VHHAVNDAYLDRNYGGVLIVWDRLFGSFREEGEKCVYGTRSPLNSWDPLWSNAEVYCSLARDCWHARSWLDKVRVWIKPPGWRPADVAAAFPKQPFDITTVKTYAPPVTRPVKVFAAWQFVAVLGGVAAFLWRADTAALSHNLAWFSALFAGLWAMGALLQGRISRGEVLLIECAALSMASAATGWTAVHLIFKPLTMVVALAVVIAATRSRANGLRGAPWLLAALAASLAGDVFLMLEGLFIPGLAAFLLAHMTYIALFRQGVPWLANRPAAWGVAAVGLGMYTVLWFGGLPPGLRGPVAAYVLAIGLMAAQALGRASVQRDGPSMVVAVGAACFMLSDALLAINRFVSPLPMSAFWVLGSYYAAQCLMVMGVLRIQRCACHGLDRNSTPFNM
jgi:uncharacterized membrane protein YhhN